MNKAYLVLSDGTVYEGTGFGAESSGVGELVFTTGMVGYLETLTDPSYAGQIILQTFPLIGNYGVIESDFEGECSAKGYVVREWCDAPSNFRSQYDLDKFLKDRGVPGICGVDTRAITRKIREQGVMNAMICREIPADLSPIQNYAVTGVVDAVTCAQPSVHPAMGEMKKRVALIDYGAKRNIVRELQKRGCEVSVLPATASAETILALQPDGVMLSNGPGDRRHAHLHHQPEPWLRRRLRIHPEGTDSLRQCQRRHLRGRRLSRMERLYRAVPPRGLLRAEGHFFPVRPIHDHDGRRAECR